jgi:hypothetical protein
MKASPLAPAYVAPVATWTGFYFGINGGYGWGRDRVDFNGLGPIFLAGDLSEVFANFGTQFILQSAFTVPVPVL